MWKVYQNKTVDNDGYGDCLNACIASILELPLSQCSSIKPTTKGDFNHQWRIFLATLGYRLAYHLIGDEDDVAPKGYSIATVTTTRLYPEGHRKAGDPIYHAVVAFNGTIIHDPFPLGSTITKIVYYQTLVPLSDVEILLRDKGVDQLVCLHEYKTTCLHCGQEQKITP